MISPNSLTAVVSPMPGTESSRAVDVRADEPLSPGDLFVEEGDVPGERFPDRRAGLTALADEAGVELELRDVDTERRESHCGHPFPGYTRGGPALWMQAHPHGRGLGYRPASARRGAPGADLTHRLWRPQALKSLTGTLVGSHGHRMRRVWTSVNTQGA
jgi:hypothetical protein